MTSAAGASVPRRGPKLEPLLLSDDERAVLERWTRRATSAQALALRARIVLASAGPGVAPIVTGARGVRGAADATDRQGRRGVAGDGGPRPQGAAALPRRAAGRAVRRAEAGPAAHHQ